MTDLRILALAAGLLASPTLVDACCGLYVAKSEANPYDLRHACEGTAACEAARIYQAGLPARGERLAQALADLTGEEVDPIRARTGLDVPEPPPSSAERWWGRIWKD